MLHSSVAPSIYSEGVAEQFNMALDEQGMKGIKLSKGMPTIALELLIPNDVMRSCDPDTCPLCYS